MYECFWTNDHNSNVYSLSSGEMTIYLFFFRCSICHYVRKNNIRREKEFFNLNLIILSGK
jgi:hypothetical protein